MMLTGDNGILTNAQQTSTQSAYKGAEEQVKIAYMAVKTEIMAKTVEDGTYNPTTEDETARLAEIVRKDLGTEQNGTWAVDGTTAGAIKITYTNSKIDQGVIGNINLTKLSGETESTLVPREEGKVHYQINLLESQDAKLFVDTADDVGGETPGGGAGLSSEEQTALKTNGIAELTATEIDGDTSLSSDTKTALKDTKKIKAVLTGDVPIPVDATYITGTKNTGVVIEYKGSEFVWVPVPVAIKTGSELIGANGPKPMAKVATVSGYAGTNEQPNYEGVLYNFSVSGESQEETSSYGQGTTSYKEPDKLSDYDTTSYNYLKDIGFKKTVDSNEVSDPDTFLSTLKADYKKMVESVAKYGGFYVGRYETSIDSETVVASKKSTETTTIMPMTAETTSGNMWYGMYDKQKKFSTTGLQSSMIWGSQYDAMLNWMLTGSNDAKTRVSATTYGNHNNTGAVGCGTWKTTNNNNDVYDVINNIYDLEGNVLEWTLEAGNTSCRVYRGGFYYFASTPSYRGNYGPHDASAGLGSRLSLYIK